jgi:hypothetical protein
MVLIFLSERFIGGGLRLGTKITLVVLSVVNFIT